MDPNTTNNEYDPESDPIYRSLPLEPRLFQTRLVLLQPGRPNDDICCTLDVVALGEKPHFEALSYVWGDGKENLPTISLNGHPHRITANLDAALRRLRSETEVRALWVDAIGMNQRNLKERGEQVALMRDVYRQCDRVLIWLGDGSVPRSTGEQPCVWSTDYTPWLESDHMPTIHEDDLLKIKSYDTEFIRYSRRPKALRHSLQQDYQLGAFCLVSLLAQYKHITEADIPSFLAHLSRQKIIEALSEIMTRTWWSRQWVIVSHHSFRVPLLL